MNKSVGVFAIEVILTFPAFCFIPLEFARMLFIVIVFFFEFRVRSTTREAIPACSNNFLNDSFGVSSSEYEFFFEERSDEV